MTETRQALAMAGTTRRERVAIALSFTAAVALLATAHYFVPALLGAGRHAFGSAMPAAQGPTPAVSPAAPAGSPITITVTADGQSTSTEFPVPSTYTAQPDLLVPQGSRVAMTVSITMPDGLWLGGFTLGIAEDPTRAPLVVQQQLLAQSSLEPGQQYVFDFHWSATGVGLGHSEALVMTGDQADGSVVEATVATFGPR
jgi:hypothetical protein